MSTSEERRVNEEQPPESMNEAPERESKVPSWTSLLSTSVIVLFIGAMIYDGDDPSAYDGDDPSAYDGDDPSAEELWETYAAASGRLTLTRLEETISRECSNDCPEAEELMENWDRDRNGWLDREEFLRGFREFQAEL
jgi:hypothetical protein